MFSMKLAFEEEQIPYESPSQSARAWTERWVRDWAYCPNRGQSRIQKYENKRPVADFHCVAREEEYELKSQ
jgi:type II restriction enzyme